MPYISDSKRVSIKASPRNCSTVGDLNYYITTRILAEWAKQPSYTMIHVLHGELVQHPKDNPMLNVLRRELSDRFTVGDIYSAAALAFNEFYRRVGALYEENKLKENGDLPEYQEAIKALSVVPAGEAASA